MYRYTDTSCANPFLFPVSDVVQNDTVNRIALTPEQKETYLNYLLADKCRKKYYDEVMILLETGMLWAYNFRYRPKSSAGTY